MKYAIYLLAFLTTSLSLNASIASVGPQANFSAKTGSVKFKAIGRPAAIKIEGVGEGAQGNLLIAENVASGTFEFNLASLKTGIALRDEHMTKKYLETDKFMKTTLTINSFKLPDEFLAKAETEIKDIPFTGVLSLHGQEKPVSGKVDLKKNVDGLVKVSARTEISLDDFGIQIPSYLGITVAKTVSINVDSETNLSLKD